LIVAPKQRDITFECKASLKVWAQDQKFSQRYNEILHFVTSSIP